LLRALAHRLRDVDYGSVLDIGCENAGVGCFATTLKPHARLVGLDIEDRALQAGAELATALALDAEFTNLDITSPDWQIGGPFDVVLSMRSIAGNALGERDFTVRDETLGEVFRQIRSVISQNGVYIAFERLRNAERSYCFASAASRHGLSLDSAQSAVLIVQEIPGTVERIPLLVFRPVEHAEAPRRELLDELHLRAAHRAAAQELGV
jgi:SAM-dependent methyltransferase